MTANDQNHNHANAAQQPREGSLLPVASTLTDAYLLNHPQQAALRLPELPAAAVAEILAQQPVHVIARLVEYFPPGAIDSIVNKFDDELVAKLLGYLPAHSTAQIISRQEITRKAELNALLKQYAPSIASEIEELLSWPEGSIGEFMNPAVQALPQGITVEQAIMHLKKRNLQQVESLFIVNEKGAPVLELEPGTLLLADKREEINKLGKPVKAVLNAMDPLEEANDVLDSAGMRPLPVCNIHGALVGVISARKIYSHAREELASDMQTMVGASKEERALSSSWFAVKKRLPWLQINLLTAFLAAAVVGAFENLIAQFTALAILLPVAAGQSGNAGAQALAVTMRGLTLREITTRHWLSVLLKESQTGLINGVAIALTCALGVYVWSGSFGLSLVIALAMVVSLVIACSSGALVPIVLKRFGLDPAQSSSIVLTTVTDIAGFMSFLGIATLLSGMLS